MKKINIGLNIQLFAAPTVTFAPLDNATGVVTDAPTITATFSEAVRNINDSCYYRCNVTRNGSIQKEKWYRC